MKELHQTAFAYYRDAPKQIQMWVDQLFEEMDEDGNDQVSLQEFLTYMDILEDCRHLSTRRFFDELKQEGSEGLKFPDVVTLFYIVYSGRPFCNGQCSNFIKGGYFTCVKCFHHSTDNFNVCTTCYVDGKYVHDGHNEFLDNFLLLQTKRRPIGANMNQRREASSIISESKSTPEPGSGITPAERNSSSSSSSPSCSFPSSISAETSNSSSSSGTLTPEPSSSSTTTSNALVPVNPRPNNSTAGRKVLKTIEVVLALGNIFVASTQCTIM